MNNILSHSKNRFFFFTASLKRNIIPIIFLLFTMSLILFSNTNLVAAKNGLKLWANNVIPALFPFFIATELLSYTSVAEKVSHVLNKFMRPLFNVPGNAAYAFFLGVISGYPVGAKIVTSFRLSNLCTKDEGERMLAFTNNSGPLFIVGTVGIALFRNSSIGFLLLFTHILASITVAIILGVFSRLHTKSNLSAPYNYARNSSNKICTISNLGEVIGTSILNAIKTILLIGGFVVLFSVIISILNTSKVINIISLAFSPLCKVLGVDSAFIRAILTGLLELTNGVSLVCSIPSKILTINIVICAFLLGFGGLSVLLQVFSITSKSDLSIKPYIYGKLLQGIIAAFYTYILISNCSFFYFNI